MPSGPTEIPVVVTVVLSDAKAAPPATKPAQPAKAEKAPRPQYGSKDDHQLNQALSILRGQQTVSNQ